MKSTNNLIVGDCIEVMRDMDNESVDCIEIARKCITKIPVQLDRFM